jgi:hypothetical protein
MIYTTITNRLAYGKALAILQKRASDTPDAIPAELWNNIGVFNHILGNFEKAEEAYTNAINVSSAGSSLA